MPEVFHRRQYTFRRPFRNAPVPHQTLIRTQ